MSFGDCLNSFMLSKNSTHMPNSFLFLLLLLGIYVVIRGFMILMFNIIYNQASENAPSWHKIHIIIKNVKYLGYVLDIFFL